MKYILFIISLIFCWCITRSMAQGQSKTDLLIIGGGASGTTAGIQAARMGIKTIIVEETDWLGGMLTSAGVSAIDGNHQMPSGLWGEFRQKLYNHYGGPEAVATGWVSNTLFEPSVGNKLLKEMAKEENLTILYQTFWEKVEKKEDGWIVTVRAGKKLSTIEAKLIIDATELGDVAKAVGVSYKIGMDSHDESGESMAPEQANNIVQDLTYVVILKDFGKGADKTIHKPQGYDPKEFACACDISDPSKDGGPNENCLQMMQYGRLPNNKYMINWPKCGNDIYLNIVEKSRAEREALLKKAKLHTLRFVYYLQTELGFKNLGIADDEFPTKDKLPMIPYHRESRRINGLATLSVNYVEAPYNQPKKYYRTGVAVGDYPIDHHHLKNPDAPEIDFIKIKVPSYNVPLGALIPQDKDGIIIAEKSISVTNIVNGATRLQPVVLGIGQAAGALAAVCIKQNVLPREVSIREVQQQLLNYNAYIMPFIDVKPTDSYFQPIQRIGATGILKGTGVPYKWANQTWFYPENFISEYEFAKGLKEFYPNVAGFPASGAALTVGFLANLFQKIDQEVDIHRIEEKWKDTNIEKKFSKSLQLNRGETAVLTDYHLKPFEVPVNFDGEIKKSEIKTN